MAKAQTEDVKTVPTYCYNCVAGPDMLSVTVKNGVATEIAPFFDIKDVHPGKGRICVKPYGLIQKTYNPHRIRTPMKRTNPKKGRNEDPGFVPISWEEALDTVSAKLNEIRAKGILDDSGYARVATTLGGGATSVNYSGTLTAFLSAWGVTDFSFGSGQGTKCRHSEHLYGELWHRAFTVSSDTPLSEYVLAFGDNVDSSSGVCGVRRHADARIRGYKRVQIEPHLSVTGASAAEWIPIRPKTDPAMLFALIHVLVHESERNRLDIPFLKIRSTSPYLVAPNGYYLRHPTSRKPLIWDLDTDKAVPFDTAGTDPALDGAFKVSGVEVGADDELWKHKGVECRTAFTVMCESMKEYTPEWAAKICDVPAKTIRRLANEYLDHARIGETIEIEGRTLPFRPVSVVLGKTVNNGWGGYESCWGRTLLTCLVGALEVPGGTLGTTVRVNKGSTDRVQSVLPHPDGIMDYPFAFTDKEGWQNKSTQRHNGQPLSPLAGQTVWSPALGPTHMGWMGQREGGFKNLQKISRPDIWITYRTNPLISYWDLKELEEITSNFPFYVSFAYTLDETNHFADILLPECTDFETYRLVRIGGTKYIENYWDHQGYALLQPVVEPQGEARDMTWIFNELAKRTGLLEAYNAAINRGTLCLPLKGEYYDFSLDITKEHSVEQVWEAVCKSASAELTDGKDDDGLDYFRKHGMRVKKFPRLHWYLYPHMEDQDLRFEMPYQERVKRVGQQLGNRLHENGIDWWEKQLEEYRAIPNWDDVPGIWERALEKNFNCKIEDYPFWVVSAHSMQYAWGNNAGIPLMKEAANNVAGHKGVIINTGRAKELGISDGDSIEVSSPNGQSIRCKAVTRQGIHPEVLLMIGQFGHWKTPVAKDFNQPSMNRLVPMLLDTTDSTGSGADLTKVSVKRAGGGA